MKLSQTASSYCLALSLNQFTILDDKCEFEEVEELLKDLSVSRLEWNGHFGANFFFTVSARYNKSKEEEDFHPSKADEDAAEVVRRITKLLNDKKDSPNTWDLPEEKE